MNKLILAQALLATSIVNTPEYLHHGVKKRTNPTRKKRQHYTVDSPEVKQMSNRLRG